MAASRAVSKAERAFVHDGIEQARALPRRRWRGALAADPPPVAAQDLRADGRRREDYRPITLELGPLPQARAAWRCACASLR